MCFSTVEIFDIPVDLDQIVTSQEFLLVKHSALEPEKRAKKKWNASGEVLNKQTVFRG